MAQITINIQTLDWTMGETVGLHLMLKKAARQESLGAMERYRS